DDVGEGRDDAGAGQRHVAAVGRDHHDRVARRGGRLATLRRSVGSRGGGPDVSNGGLAKVTAKTAAEVCKHFPLGDDAKKLLRDTLTPKQFLDLLLEKQQFPDAARFLAHALPKREAVWWACLGARQAYGSAAPPP